MREGRRGGEIDGDYRGTKVEPPTWPSQVQLKRRSAHVDNGRDARTVLGDPTMRTR